MRRALFLFLLAAACPGVCLAQASGNVAYSQSSGQASARARQSEQAKRGQVDVPSQTSMVIEASVLMNVKADEHVAVFGVMQECAAVPECNQKVDAAISEFSSAARGLGVGPEDIFVDFAAQNKIYGFELANNIARERLVGFELKKNVSVRYKDRLLLDRLVVAASRSGIFDLVKVDYVVSNASAVHQRLAEEAARVVRQKVARHEQLLGIKLRQPGQVYADRPSVYFPTEMYDSYAAFESESVEQNYYRRDNNVTVQNARKSRTFFFNALDADGFDLVINPVVLEPVVQFTTYLKVKYEMAQPPVRRTTRRPRR